MKYVAHAIWNENTKEIADLVFGIIREDGEPSGYKENFNVVLTHVYIGFNTENDEYYNQRTFTGKDHENTFLWVVGKESIFDNIDDARKKLIKDILK